MATFYCLFEQSGTFKNEFIKLGHKAYDFDIQDEYNQTDFVIDLFEYENIDKIIKKAVSDKATLIMFFPCTYFSTQQILWTRGANYSQRNWNIIDKIDRSQKNINCTDIYYNRLCYWIKECIKNKIPLIIENPYSPNSFLIRYLPIKPTIIDKDRRRMGDKYKKPTMWYFINIKPKDNFELMYPNIFERIYINHTKYGKERSEISSSYAEHFIKTYIL